MAEACGHRPARGGDHCRGLDSPRLQWPWHKTAAVPLFVESPQPWHWTVVTPRDDVRVLPLAIVVAARSGLHQCIWPSPSPWPLGWPPSLWRSWLVSLPAKVAVAVAVAVACGPAFVVAVLTLRFLPKQRTAPHSAALTCVAAVAEGDHTQRSHVLVHGLWLAS